MAPDTKRIRPSSAAEADPKTPATKSGFILADDYAIRMHLEAAIALLRPRCTRCLHPISAAESVRLGMGPACRRRQEVAR